MLYRNFTMHNQLQIIVDSEALACCVKMMCWRFVSKKVNMLFHFIMHLSRRWICFKSLLIQKCGRMCRKERSKSTCCFIIYNAAPVARNQHQIGNVSKLWTCCVKTICRRAKCPSYHTISCFLIMKWIMRNDSVSNHCCFKVVSSLHMKSMCRRTTLFHAF